MSTTSACFISLTSISVLISNSWNHSGCNSFVNLFVPQKISLYKLVTFLPVILLIYLHSPLFHLMKFAFRIWFSEKVWMLPIFILNPPFSWKITLCHFRRLCTFTSLVTFAIPLVPKRWRWTTVSSCPTCHQSEITCCYFIQERSLSWTWSSVRLWEWWPLSAPVCPSFR